MRHLATVLLLALLSGASSAAAQPLFCVDDFYASIQQGNSNVAPIDENPWRFNMLDHYRDFVNAEGLGAVKIWDMLHGPGHPMLDDVMNDPTIDIVVYRPLYNHSHERRRENVDYGVLATQLYQHYGSIQKIVILTGWEQDNQYRHFNQAPDTQWSYNDYRAFVQARQDGVDTARATYGSSGNLHVFHAVEVNALPNGVLENVVKHMDPKPDFVSYSAWGGLYDLSADLDVIKQKSQLPRERIFIGEYGFRGNGITATSHGNVKNFLIEARNWGVHLAFLWQFNQGAQFVNWVVYAEPEHSLRTGYQSEAGRPVARATIDAVRAENRGIDPSTCYWPFALTYIALP